MDEQTAYEIEVANNRSPERQLLCAVLLKAIQDFTTPLRVEWALRENARLWLFSDKKESTSHFTFLAICHALDLDPYVVRRSVMRLKGRIKRTDGAFNYTGCLKRMFQ